MTDETKAQTTDNADDLEELAPDELEAISSDRRRPAADVPDKVLGDATAAHFADASDPAPVLADAPAAVDLDALLDAAGVKLARWQRRALDSYLATGGPIVLNSPRRG